MVAVGTQLGPYKIVAPIGSGGMGQVFRAKDLRLDREVAVKVLAEHLISDTDAVGRFEREAKAVAALSHPSILAIHDFGTDQEICYTVTELLEGESLRSRIRRSALSWRKAVEIAIAVADGLAAAHAKGIIHRDLKPDNIFLTSTGHVKILDFGLARTLVKSPAETETATFGVARTPARTDPGTVMGTVGYMSPEQVRGQDVDARTDVFSLGCVLYEMVTGNRAFVRETGAETMASILHDEPPDLTESGKKIPPEVHRVIQHCMEKNPEERFQSVRDLAFDLRAILSDSSVSPGARHLASGRPRTAVYVAAAAGLLVVLAGSIWLVQALFPSKEEEKRAEPSKAIDSIAVLPFTNAGGDPNTEYLSDGITESLIDSLSQLPNLKVKSRSSVFRYKGQDVNPQTVGRELDVQAVLTGRVVQRADALSISLELVDVRDNNHLWGAQYNRKLTDLLALQETISKEVTEKLRLKLTGEEAKRLTKRSTENTEAYQLYLRGRFYWNKRTVDGFTQGIDYFRQAIDKDPGYALAYAGLADSYILLAGYSAQPPHEATPKAKAAAQKALELDESLAETHASLGLIRQRYDWDWPAAEKEYRRAIELNPSYATAHHWYGYFLMILGRPDEALPRLQRAQELDPPSLIINANVGFRLHFARQYDPALEQFRKTLAMDPNFPVVHFYLGLAYEQKAMYDQAIAAFQKAVALSGGNTENVAALGHAYALSGNKAEAQKLLDQLVQLAKEKYVPSSHIALVHAGLGDKDQAFQWLEKAYAERDSFLTYLKVDPRWDRLRSDSRFGDLLDRVGLPK